MNNPSLPLEGPNEPLSAKADKRRGSDTIDATDLAILRALQQDARLTVKEVAARVNLSTTPVFERIKRLEQRGYIKGYVAVVDAEKLGRGFSVFCSIKMSRISSDIAQQFAETVRDIPEVTECYNISGGYDYLLKIQVGDMKRYRELVLGVIGQIEHLASLESTFVMDELKHSYGIVV